MANMPESAAALCDRAIQSKGFVWKIAGDIPQIAVLDREEAMIDLVTEGWGMRRTAAVFG
jgi:hypothetical protein